MLNESHFICESKLWSQRGEDKFKEILAKIGFEIFWIFWKFFRNFFFKV